MWCRSYRLAALFMISFGVIAESRLDAQVETKSRTQRSPQSANRSGSQIQAMNDSNEDMAIVIHSVTLPTGKVQYHTFSRLVPAGKTITVMWGEPETPAKGSAIAYQIRTPHGYTPMRKLTAPNSGGQLLVQASKHQLPNPLSIPEVKPGEVTVKYAYINQRGLLGNKPAISARARVYDDKSKTFITKKVIVMQLGYDAELNGATESKQKTVPFSYVEGSVQWVEIDTGKFYRDGNGYIYVGKPDPMVKKVGDDWAKAAMILAAVAVVAQQGNSSSGNNPAPPASGGSGAASGDMRRMTVQMQYSDGSYPGTAFKVEITYFKGLDFIRQKVEQKSGLFTAELPRFVHEVTVNFHSKSFKVDTRNDKQIELYIGKPPLPGFK